MSPTDEIRYINKLAAKKGVKGLSAYQKWVYGGCRGPNPRRMRKPKGRCPKTVEFEPIVLTRKEIVSLRERWVALKTELRDARHLALELTSLVGDLEKEVDGIGKLLTVVSDL